MSQQPRPRPAHHISNLASMNAKDVQVSNAQSRSARGGQTLNHLLSFTLPPRARPPAPQSARRGRRAANYVPFNKERYINAQYRFLVKPTGDYTAHFADPDIYLNWSDILQVLIPTSTALSAVSSSSNAAATTSVHTFEHEGATCPICLSPPTAPRMTKCGHVYCYPCMLHYLALGEDTGTVNFSRSSHLESSNGSYNRPGAPPRRVGALATPPGSSTPACELMHTASALSAKSWRRCPICWDAVYAKDLKAVKWWDPQQEARRWTPKVLPENAEPSDAHASFEILQELNLHNHLPMRLIERPQITTLALPQSSFWPGNSEDDFMPPHAAPWHFQPDVLPFAKFMLASPALIEDALNEDLSQLEVEKVSLENMLGERDELSLQFVQVAKRKVMEQIEKVKVECDTQGVRSTIERKKRQFEGWQEVDEGEHGNSAPTTTLVEAPSVIEDDAQGAPSRQMVKSSPIQIDENLTVFLAIRPQSQGGQIPNPSLENQQQPQQQLRKDTSRTRRNVNPPSPSPSSYFYYQAASGQNIFLHPLDIKVLHSKYGSYSAFPHTIHVKVSGADEGSMNEDLRRRCKYLTHIPTAADVVFIEVDWWATNGEGQDGKALKLSPEVLNPYMQALRQRKSRRRDRGRKEDRAKLKADEQEAAETSARNRMGPAQEYKELTHNWPSADLASSYGAVNGSARLSTSFGSGRGGGSENSSLSSPSFREAALVGAEREFPVHPGGPTEDFPAVPRQAHDADEAAGITNQAGPTATTVWGTRAQSRTAFSVALQRGHRGDADEMWERDVDDAWLELEEDFLLGATSGGRRNTGTVKEGRGLNKQPRSGTATPRVGAGSSHTPPSRSGGSPEASSASTPRAGPDDGREGQPESSSGRPRATAAPRAKSKKKLVLTSGGRGMA